MHICRIQRCGARTASVPVNCGQASASVRHLGGVTSAEFAVESSENGNWNAWPLPPCLGAHSLIQREDRRLLVRKCLEFGLEQNGAGHEESSGHRALVALAETGLRVWEIGFPSRREQQRRGAGLAARGGQPHGHTLGAESRWCYREYRVPIDVTRCGLVR